MDNNKLNKEQKIAVETLGCSLLIVAGAGCGKTRVLVEKMIYLLKNGVEEDNLVALTFTNKAADEMRERVEKGINKNINFFIGTFHSYCAHILRIYGDDIGIDSDFQIADNEKQKTLLKRCKKETGETELSISVIQRQISEFKRNNISVDELLPGVEKIYFEYQKKISGENLLDFDDLILQGLQLLRSSEKTKKILNDKYKYILIDEYQDTDESQSALIKLMKGNKTNIVAVGDTDQTIYTWRGATVDNMLSFIQTFRPAKEVFLTQNYRSTKNIIDAANNVINKNLLRQDKELKTDKNGGEKISMIRAANGEHEAMLIIEEIQKLVERGYNYTDIVILFRANFQSRELEKHLIINNIPYTVLGARFFDRAEIKGLLSFLSLTKNINNYDELVRAANISGKGVGKMTIEKFIQGREISPQVRRKLDVLLENVKFLKKELSNGTLESALFKFLEKIDYKTYIKNHFDNSAERWKEVGELLSYARRFSKLDGETAVTKLLEEASLGSDQDTLRYKQKGVRLMTVHSAKGLEFPIVFITGMEEDLFPMRRGDGVDSDMEEERRLCYVAITRAIHKLYFSYASKRFFFGNFITSIPSSFLGDIPEGICEPHSEDSDNVINW